jgi:hypothetical protein
MDPDLAFYDSALSRVGRWTVALTAAGWLVLVLWKGWTWAFAYLLGAAASYLNLLWLKRVVEALSGAAQARPSPRFAILIGLRYLLLAAGAYAIVTFTSLSLPAALTGLFVPAAAVILEIVFELIYASR